MFQWSTGGITTIATWDTLSRQAIIQDTVVKRSKYYSHVTIREETHKTGNSKYWNRQQRNVSNSEISNIFYIHKQHAFSALTLVGWVSRRASGPQKMSNEVLVWLSVWSEVDCLHMVQLMPLPPKIPSSLASFKSRLVLPFWYWFTEVILEKRSLNGCSKIAIFRLHNCAVLTVNLRTNIFGCGISLYLCTVSKQVCRYH